MSKNSFWAFRRTFIILSSSNTHMVHKIKYFEAAKLESGIFLQDVVNEFLAQKGDKIIAVHPVMGDTLLVHYEE